MPENSFLRVDRGEALFASDAPKRGFEIGDLPGFSVRIENGIAHITPLYENAPCSVRPFLTEYLKAQGEKRDRLLRQSLALSMRKGDMEAGAYLKTLLEKETDGNEASVDGTRLL